MIAVGDVSLVPLKTVGLQILQKVIKNIFAIKRAIGLRAQFVQWQSWAFRVLTMFRVDEHCTVFAQGTPLVNICQPRTVGFHLLIRQSLFDLRGSKL